jgi:hypothetical protein
LIKERPFEISDLDKITFREHEIYNVYNYREILLSQINDGYTITLALYGEDSLDSYPLFILGFIPEESYTAIWGLSDVMTDKYPLSTWKFIWSSFLKYKKIFPPPYVCTINPERPETLRTIERLGFTHLGIKYGGQLLYVRN